MKDGAFGNKGHDLPHLSILAGKLHNISQNDCRLCLYFIYLFCPHWQCTDNIVQYQMPQLSGLFCR